MRYGKVLWLITFTLFIHSCYCQSTAKKHKNDLRLQRLNSLADIWGNLAIHHPKLVGQEGAWDSVLTAAIPQIEKAKATEDFVQAINNSLFSYVNDFSSYASILNQAIDTTAIHIHTDTISAIKLSNEVGYIAVPGSSNYDIGLSKKIYQAVTQLKPISRLIIDLRSNKKSNYSTDWLTLWSEKEFTPGPSITPVYTYYSTNGQYWLTKASYPFKPVLDNKEWLKRIYPGVNTEDWKTIQIPTVFIVNYNSYAMVGSVLDALQKQNNVTVLFDKTNMIERGNLLYAEKIRVNINSDMILAYDGGLGIRPDTVLQNVPVNELISLSKILLAHKNTRSARSPFVFKVFDEYVPTQPATSLSREQRIMGLMKLWTNVKYFYAYPEQIAIDWTNLLYEWIPRVEAIESTNDYYAILQEITTYLHDNHVMFSHPMIHLLPDAKSLSLTIPVLLLKVQDKVLVSQIDSAAGSKFPLAIGDEILEVDGKNILQIESYYRKQVSFAQESGFIRNVWEYAYAIRGSADSIVTLLVRNKNKEKIVRLKKTENYQRVTSIHPFGKKIVELLPGNIGYIRLYHVANVDELDNAFTILKNTQGLIFDLRGGNAPYNYRFPGDMRKLLVDRLTKDPFERRSFRITYRFTDGEDVAAKTDESFFYFPDTSTTKIHYDKPIVVITTSRQQSYGEGILQILQSAKRVTFVGSPTVGTNGGMSAVRFPDGGSVTFTKDHALNPVGKPFHGVGIVPDVKIEPTILGIRTRKDEVLEKAIEVINSKTEKSNN